MKTTAPVTKNTVSVGSVMIEIRKDKFEFQKTLNKVYEDALSRPRHENKLPEIHFSTIIDGATIVYTAIVIWIAEA